MRKLHIGTIFGRQIGIRFGWHGFRIIEPSNRIAGTVYCGLFAIVW